jgi:hypothetical protein
MEEVRQLRERVVHRRVVARHVTDPKAIDALEALARRLEEQIARLEEVPRGKLPGAASDGAPQTLEINQPIQYTLQQVVEPPGFGGLLSVPPFSKRSSKPFF